MVDGRSIIRSKDVFCHIDEVSRKKGFEILLFHIFSHEGKSVAAFNPVSGKRFIRKFCHGNNRRAYFDILPLSCIDATDICIRILSCQTGRTDCQLFAKIAAVTDICQSLSYEKEMFRLVSCNTRQEERFKTD